MNVPSNINHTVNVNSVEPAVSTVLSETMPDKVINNVQVVEANNNEEMVASKRGCNRCQDCTGYVAAQDWRRSTCSKCRCPRSSHDMVVGSTCCALDRIGFDLTAFDNPKEKKQSQIISSSTTTTPSDTGCRVKTLSETEGYSWVPMGIPQSRLEEWMHSLPANKMPKLNTTGEAYRETQLLQQLPKQDLSLRQCHHISPKDQSSYQDFICARNDIALDIGHAVVISKDLNNSTNSHHRLHHNHAKEDPKAPLVTSTNAGQCRKCNETMKVGDLAVVAPRFALRDFWHPACFTCTVCEELLVDLSYCVHNDNLYCERHYAENLKPRCGACDELIFDGQYTKALGKDFHSEHFVCVSCNLSLTGHRYVLTDEHPCCIPCYEQNFTHNCRVCERRIGLDSKDMSYKDLHWHEECFKCRKCKDSLVEKPFAAKNALIFCANCYDEEFATRCDACGDTFRPGMKKMEYKTRKWHDKCFQCVVCKSLVGSKPFIIPNENDVYCVGCFEEKFANKCTKCKKIMTTGGVTFKNEAWHRECFLCTNCGCVLAGQKFASRNDKPYCANCFGELFAKRCTSCSKPITGAGGTRFISFEGRHWHSQCFVCASCKDSMAGKGFITDGEDIICPDCAKEKLMATGASGSTSS